MKVKVGILRAVRIEFSLSGGFTDNFGRHVKEGSFVAELSDDAILFDGRRYDELYFRSSGGAVFVLDNVVIGKDFHWQQKRRQRFGGDLQILIDGDELVAVNHIDMEQYLYSVIASEMSSTSFLELLKAHAVISRSWVVSAINGLQNIPAPTSRIDDTNSDNPVYIRWYERDAHSLFHVCADDHCQRYQGIPDVEPPTLREAIESTEGEVLTYGGIVCDARFSKCCGGYTERFSSCWADMDYPYLATFSDDVDGRCRLDLTDEQAAREYISSKPDVFCNTDDDSIVGQVFNDYDRRTQSFFRWRVHYSQSEISEIVRQRSGIDFGDIVDLVPVRRSGSGRIVSLRVVGSRRTATVGKELEIRRWLSRSHLYSSAFVVDKGNDGSFTLTGAGWGHGVGLCQIGAAVMARQGYGYRQILEHYYPHTTIEKLSSSPSEKISLVEHQ